MTRWVSLDPEARQTRNSNRLSPCRLLGGLPACKRQRRSIVASVVAVVAIVSLVRRPAFEQLDLAHSALAGGHPRDLRHSAGRVAHGASPGVDLTVCHAHHGVEPLAGVLEEALLVLLGAVALQRHDREQRDACSDHGGSASGAVAVHRDLHMEGPQRHEDEEEDREECEDGHHQPQNHLLGLQAHDSHDLLRDEPHDDVVHQTQELRQVHEVIATGVQQQEGLLDLKLGEVATQRLQGLQEVGEAHACLPQEGDQGPDLSRLQEAVRAQLRVDLLEDELELGFADVLQRRHREHVEDQSLHGLCRQALHEVHDDAVFQIADLPQIPRIVEIISGLGRVVKARHDNPGQGELTPLEDFLQDLQRALAGVLHQVFPQPMEQKVDVQKTVPVGIPVLRVLAIELELVLPANLEQNEALLLVGHLVAHVGQDMKETLLPNTAQLQERLTT
mmetsp:Transcript_117283/g.373596  ORF Transcript_117283/g.373596 Transcript_117283/m.373596 type:complete len:447 (-) Transcript_117283:6199-7539(-)